MIPLAAIPGSIQGILGLGQLVGGSAMNLRRPAYEIPEAAKEELALSRMQRNSRMPGIGYAENRIGQNSAASAYRLNRAATNPNQILAGLAGIQMQANIASRGLMEAEAGDALRRESNLRRSLGMMANYQQKKWEFDKMQPYMDKARTKAALIGAGLQNLAGGVNQGVGAVLYQNNLEADRKAYEQQYRNAGQPVNPFINQQGMFGSLASIF